MLMLCNNKNLLVDQWDHFKIVHMKHNMLLLCYATEQAITQIGNICYDLVINSVLQNCLTFEHCTVQKANWI